MRLIDADEIVLCFDKKYETAFKSAMRTMDYSMRGFCDGVDWGERIIKKAPTIEAEPVRHRTWVIKTHDDGYGAYQVKHCPDCDRGLPVEYDADYCPKCGAKMDGKGE